MKPNELDTLIDDCLEGRLNEADAARLSAYLEQSAEARARYWEVASIHGLLESSLQTASLRVVTGQGSAIAPNTTRWMQWRPLTAAAAGLVFGMFCTSMVFGFVVPRGGERKLPVALFELGFENAQMAFAKDFPDTSARWGGDAAQVVAAENGVQPKEGKFMLRLEPALRGSPRVYQVLDLESLPSNPESGMRQIEIAASFAPADAAASVRYLIRAFAVSDAPESLDAAWFDRRDQAIASSMIGLDGLPRDQSWQTFGLRIQVPPTARSLVLFFGVRTPDKSLPKAANYLDDVQVSLIEPQPLP